MDSPKSTARLAGFLYVVMSALMIFSYMYVPSRFLSDDAATTARNIADGASLYRLTILISLVSQILFVVVALTLYRLFRDVDRALARLMVGLVGVAIAAELVTIANRMTPLILLSGESYLSAFTKPQLDALVMGSILWGNNLARILTIFWGLWLFPFGILTIKSGYFPKILGYLLFASGVGYVVTSVTIIAFPEHIAAVSRVMSPLYFGELGMVLWLPFMGARDPAEHAETEAEPAVT
ncbi:MAG TPA: DUF4386 domain-containing protein [Candidatus Eisenbacteria bacterium]|nr:DUF4386 domain-containing protein [Candidatus Eisenbacteria bacterium]